MDERTEDQPEKPITLKHHAYVDKPELVREARQRQRSACSQSILGCLVLPVLILFAVVMIAAAVSELF